MKKLTKEQELEHKLKMIQMYEDALGRQKDDSKDNSSNAVDEEAEEESVHPILMWFTGLVVRLNFIAQILIYSSAIIWGAFVFGDSNDKGYSFLLNALIGAGIGFVIAYIFYKIINVISRLLIWIIWGK